MILKPLILDSKDFKFKKTPAVMVTVPTGGNIHTNTVKSLLNLQSDMQKKGLRHHFNFSTSSFLPHGRAQVCGASLDRGIHQWPFDAKEITHIMMIDSDIIFTPDDFWKLFEHDVPVVAGAYCYGTEALVPENDKKIVAGMWDNEYFKKYFQFPSFTLGQAREHANPLLDVDWMGLGFCLARAEVFHAIEYPWFNSEKMVIEQLVDTTSEDVGWCLKVKRSGYGLFLDPSVKVGHQKMTVI